MFNGAFNADWPFVHQADSVIGFHDAVWVANFKSVSKLFD